MTKELRIHNGERIVSSIEDDGKARQSHAKKYNWTPILYCAQNQLKIDWRCECKKTWKYKTPRRKWDKSLILVLAKYFWIWHRSTVNRSKNKQTTSN